MADRAVPCEGFELVRVLYTRSARGQKTEGRGDGKGQSRMGSERGRGIK